MDASVVSILNKIRPLIAPLSAEERLAVIQAIACEEPGQTGQDVLAREQEAWFSLPVEERKRYAGDYVAVTRGEVVDHDPDQRTIYLRVRERFGRQTVLIIPAAWDEMPTLVHLHQGGVRDSINPG